MGVLLGGAALLLLGGERSPSLQLSPPGASAQNPTPILPTAVPIDPPTAQPTATSIWGPLEGGRIHLPLALRAAPPVPAKRGGVQLGSTPLGMSLSADGAWATELEGPRSWRTLVREELPRARALGIGIVRLPVRWREIEPLPGQRDWRATEARLADVAAAGMTAHVVLVDYPSWAMTHRCGGGLRAGRASDWRMFLEEAAQRWAGRVAIWELGNEPDGESKIEEDDHQRPPERGGGQPTTPERGCWGGQASAYADFFVAGADALRSVQPEAIVLPGTFAAETLPLDHDPDFLEAFLQTGAAGAADAIAYRWQPQAGDGIFEARRVARIVGDARVSLPLWLTETGQYTERDPRFLADSYATQLHFVTRDLVRLAVSGAVARIYWHGWRDMPPVEGEDPLMVDPGLVNAAGEPKPAWHALAYVLAHAADRSAVVASRLGSEAFRFRGADEETWLLWSTTGDKGYVSLPLPPGADPNAPADKVFFAPAGDPTLPWVEQRRRVAPREGRVRIVTEPVATFVHIAIED